MKIASYTTYIESDYGTSILHNVIACNLFAKLRTHLKAPPCRALIEGEKLRLRKEQSYFYPDVMLTSEDRLQELNSLQQIIEAQVEIYRPHGDICWGSSPTNPATPSKSPAWKSSSAWTKFTSNPALPAD